MQVTVVTRALALSAQALKSIYSYSFEVVAPCAAESDSESCPSPILSRGQSSTVARTVNHHDPAATQAGVLLQRASEETRTASKGKKSLRAMARRRRGTSTLSHTGPGRGPNDVATGAATVVEHKGLCLYCNEPVLSTQLRGSRMKEGTKRYFHDHCTPAKVLVCYVCNQNIAKQDLDRDAKGPRHASCQG